MPERALDLRRDSPIRKQQPKIPRSYVLPDQTRTRVTLETEHESRSRWKKSTRFGHLTFESMFANSLQFALKPTANERTFENFDHDYDRKLIIWHAPFILQHLYLDATEYCTPRHFDVAARISLLLGRYWERKRPAGQSSDAMSMLMAVRTRWLALEQVKNHIESVQVQVVGSVDTLEAYYALLRASAKSAPPSLSWIGDWLPNQTPYVDIREEYLKALREWQATIIDDDYAHFFIEILSYWRYGEECDWELLRETELNETIWNPPVPPTSHIAFRDPFIGPPFNEQPLRQQVRDIRDRKDWKTDLRTGTAADRAALRHVLYNWYLPRYNLKRARWISYAIHKKESKLRAGWFIRLKTFPLGVVRLWASIGASAMVISFAPDVWEILIKLLHQHKTPELFALISALLAGPFLYLAIGIHRRTGIRRTGIILARTWDIWWRGQVFALLLGTLITWAIGNMELKGVDAGTEIMTGLDVISWTGAFIIAIYAQITIALGIFVQLLFDDKPTTAPLEAP